MADLISRQAAIDALCDNCNNVQAVCPHYPCKQYTAINALPSAQPELIAQGAYVRGFEQGRTQGMLDAKLQPTCNQLATQLATDCISRQAAIDELDKGAWGVKWDKALAKAMIESLPSAQPDVPDTNVGDINKFIDGLVEIFADIRESHVDDSVCGLCEFDGAYIGESGDWCNECPGFNRDDCFKLRDGIRKKWIAEITGCLPSEGPEIIRCKECVDYDTSWIPYSAPDRHYCPTMDSFMPDDAFCSYAERRTDG